VKTQPVEGLHESSVHGFESSQSLSATHLHADVSCWQVPAEHVSTLQATPSSQLIGVPLQ
jgi:hypothetical protein